MTSKRFPPPGGYAAANMRSFESSTRVRYWMERFQEFLRCFPSFGVFGVFGLTVAGIILVALLSDRVLPCLLIFVAGVGFARELRVLSKTAPKQEDGPVPFSTSADPSAHQVDALLRALHGIENRLTQLEASMSSKEYEWERRLYQTPPSNPSSSRLPPNGA